MLNQRVIIKHSASCLAGKEGIIVAVQKTGTQDYDNHENTQCKLLIGDQLSNWIPYLWLEVVQNYSPQLNTASRLKIAAS